LQHSLNAGGETSSASGNGGSRFTQLAANQQYSVCVNKQRAVGVILLFVLFGPFFILRSPVVPQALVRMIAVSFWAFAMPVAIFWFGIKSHMIRKGGKLYEPQYDDVRPKIERNIRFGVIAFGVFYFFVLSLPFAEDLIQVAIGHRLSRITKAVTYIKHTRGALSQDIGLSGSDKNYYLFYPSKTLRVDNTYEFVVLPQSRVILDYGDLTR
jgi:hypothetical protein